MIKRDVLVIEDDKVFNRLVLDHLKEAGYEATSVYNWKEAKKWLEAHEPDLIILDVRLPDADGIELVAKEQWSQPVIILTAYASVQSAVDAMQAGAADYLVKPVNFEELDLVIRRVLENASIRKDHQFQKTLQASRGDAYMVGESEALTQVKRLIEAVAPSDMTVLVQGESGVGKELVAKAIHQHSQRVDRNYVAVDCCTIQETLFESELFGYERGAFTGADRQKNGLIEGAESGTLFLDEIGEIDPSAQAKLLRVLEAGTYRRVGGTKDIKANVRIIAATNRDLEQHSQDGQFRYDLFYRLNAFTIQIPPLRERREDIPALATHFIANHSFSRRINLGISDIAMQSLINYEWPGNIRELKNVIERAIILSQNDKEIRPRHLTFTCENPVMQSEVALQFEHEPTLAEMSRDYMETLLEKYNGHRATVAKIMGISERSLYRMIKKD